MMAVRRCLQGPASSCATLPRQWPTNDHRSHGETPGQGWVARESNPEPTDQVSVGSDFSIVRVIPSGSRSRVGFLWGNSGWIDGERFSDQGLCGGSPGNRTLNLRIKSPPLGNTTEIARASSP